MDIKDFFQTLFYLLTFSDTKYIRLNEFLDTSSFVMAIVMTAGILLLIFLNPRLREHKRYEDRLIFSECMLVLIALLLDIFTTIGGYAGSMVEPFLVYIAPTLEELLYILVILQWVVFVDYSLYRSRDHIRSRRRFLLLAVLLVLLLDVGQSVLIYVRPLWMGDSLLILYLFQILKFVVEFACIFCAIRMVVRYSKESRQPKFLSLSAFIIPFVIGVLFRFYDESMMALGVILTYGAVIRRDKYLDPETGFYNEAFIDYISTYRDRKQYEGGNAFLISAPGHKKECAEILKQVMPEDANLFCLEEGGFLVLSESLRGSAAGLAVQTIVEMAESSDPSFTPEVSTAKRRKEETAEQFTERLGLRRSLEKEPVQ